MLLALLSPLRCANLHFAGAFSFAFPAHFWQECRKVENYCRKMQNFSVVFSMFCNFLKRKVKISSKIGLTFGEKKCILNGTPSRGSPKG